MSSSTRPSLSLLTLNVNGLGSAAKRRTLFNMLMDGPWDVIVLQETHHTDREQGIRWAGEGAGEGRPWDGDSYWAHGTSASRGVAILTRARAILTDAALQDDDPSGRILRLDFSWASLPISVVAYTLQALRKNALLSMLVVCCQLYLSIAMSSWEGITIA